ncbi:MAG: phosphoglycerate mutase family protein [Candidatus Pacearchaeota archaeon]|jgi:broad specificity phosphatase PhoE
MIIFLVRHGESEKTDKDPGLTQNGKYQSKRVAFFLKDLQIDKAYSSNLKRAKQTLEEYQKLCPKTNCEKVDNLNEIYRTIIGGPSKEGTSPNREEKDKARADEFFSKLIEMKARNIVLFTHGNLIRYFLSKALEIDAKTLWNNLVLSPGSVSVIEKQGDDLRVKAVNIISHQDSKYLKDFYKDVSDEAYLP